jgi:translation initiation factor 2B subunit (eIF-2B alpha/beta/delta family)
MLTTDKSAASIQSATELFLRFISIVETEHSGEFDLLMDVYKKRGAQFIRRISQSRAIISNFALPFIQHNSVGSLILTRGYQFE